MPFRGKPGRGGRRQGSGRKPSPKTQLARLALAELEEEAEKSIRFMVKLRDDTKVGASVRFAAAQDLIDRRFGRAKQSVGLSNDGQPLTVTIIPAVALKPDEPKGD